MNEFERTPGFMERYRSYYLTNGHLTGEQFDEAKRLSDQVQALNLLPGVYWGITPQLTIMYPKLLSSIKFRAQAAGLDRPFKSITDYTSSTYTLSVLKRSSWPTIPKPQPPPRIGKFFRELGLITDDHLQRILGIQQIIRDETGVSARFGVLAMRVAGVSLVDLFQVVGIQVGIPYENMDQFITEYEKRFDTCASP